MKKSFVLKKTSPDIRHQSIKEYKLLALIIGGKIEDKTQLPVENVITQIYSKMTLLANWMETS